MPPFGDAAANRERTSSTLQYESRDGELLPYRWWPSLSQARRGMVVLVYLGVAPAPDAQDLVVSLDLKEFDFVAWEVHLSGRMNTLRSPPAPFQSAQRELQSFAKHLCAQHDIAIEDLVVLAEGDAAVLAASWARDFAPSLRGVVLIAPQFAQRRAAGCAPLRRESGPGRPQDAHGVRSPRTSGWLGPARPGSRLPGWAPALERGRDHAVRRLLHDPAGITQPLQLIACNADAPTARQAMQAFVAATRSNLKQFIEAKFEGSAVISYLGSQPSEAVRRFVRHCFDDRAPRVAALTPAATQPLGIKARDGKATDRIARALIELGLRTAGRLSPGLRAGCKRGFHSAEALDYVYRNRSSGSSLIGKLLDKLFLGSDRSRALRHRHRHVADLLRLAMHRADASNMPIRIADFAAGSARYVFEAVRRGGVRPEQVLLRDKNRLCVLAGRALARSRRLDELVTYEQADALDEDAFVDLAAKMTVTVASGLFETLPTAELVRRSLAGIARATDTGGYLVYTGRHPHCDADPVDDVLGRVANGGRHPLFPRSQADLDQLVSEAGFRKLTQRIDDWGLYTVSLAQRTRD
jgi:alpha-beta hydrolase superfamily lysophospholipase/SAM-dependent methyltransferase